MFPALLIVNLHAMAGVSDLVVILNGKLAYLIIKGWLSSELDCRDDFLYAV